MWVTLPCLMLLLDVWPFGRLDPLAPGRLAKRVAEKLPFFALSAVSCAITLRAQSVGISFALPLSTRASNALASYAAYVRRAFWPNDLAAFYPYTQTPEAGSVVAGAALLLGVTALALFRLRREPWLAVGWLWFVGMLVPVIGLVQVGLQGMADRYMYLPLVGLSIVVAWGAHAALAGLRLRDRLLATVSVVALTGLALQTRAQLPLWHDQLTLFQHALERTRDNYYAHTAVGNGWMLEGDLDRAVEHFERSLRLAPNLAWTHASLGSALRLRGDLDGAIASLSRARELSPLLPHAAFGLGRALEQSGRYAEAIEAYRAELRVSADHLGALRRLAVVLALHPSPELRDPDQALHLATRLCELTAWRSATDLDVLSAAYGSAGRFEDALRLGARALERARAEGRTNLIDGIEHRLSRYRAGQPLRLEIDD
jgi:Flp pilus assembly protein TadD